MAEKLVIVESPTKAREITAILAKMGKKGEWEVVSSKGHVCDIMDTKDNKQSREKGIRFGINFKNGFEPIYDIEPDKKKLVAELKKKADAASAVYLASDADREGEAIAWHLYNILKLTPEKTHRIAALEITPKGVADALANDRQINVDLVMAQQARRVLDRIEGYEISPLLWKKSTRVSPQDVFSLPSYAWSLNANARLTPSTVRSRVRSLSKPRSPFLTRRQKSPRASLTT